MCCSIWHPNTTPEWYGWLLTIHLTTDSHYLYYCDLLVIRNIYTIHTIHSKIYCSTNFNIYIISTLRFIYTNDFDWGNHAASTWWADFSQLIPANAPGDCSYLADSTILEVGTDYSQITFHLVYRATVRLCLCYKTSINFHSRNFSSRSPLWWSHPLLRLTLMLVSRG